MSLSSRPATSPVRFRFGSDRPAKPRLLARQNSKIHGKSIVVAVDGSEQGNRCLNVAAALMKAGEDLIKIITINSDISDVQDAPDTAMSGGAKLTPEGLLAESKAHMITLGAPSRLIETVQVDPEEDTVADAIVKQTSFLRRGAGIIVLGSSGKGAQRRQGDAGKGLGSVAAHVLLECRCPITLVKEDPIWEPHALRGLRPPMNIVTCVDSCNVRHRRVAKPTRARSRERAHLCGVTCLLCVVARVFFRRRWAHSTRPCASAGWATS